MSEVIQIDRFTRQKMSVSGKYSPSQMARLADYLAGEEGEIRYALTGSEVTDLTGSQKRCVKCIISGWFLVTDPGTLKPVRHEVAIESRLVVVRDESALPPFELEAEDEDYIICGNEMRVMERVEEEILLDLPTVLAGNMEAAAGSARAAAGKHSLAGIATETRKSPFAELAKLKKG
jgi:uncharacterized metal-binding protein YceD (DUF177 family)